MKVGQGDEWYAHSEGRNGIWQTQKEHTRAVSDGARDQAPRFLATHAYLAGLFHNLGKYAPVFKRRLEGEASGLDHWTPGAHVLFKAEYSPFAGIAVHAHHVGLGAFAQVGSLNREYRSLEGRTLTLEAKEIKGALVAFREDGFALRLDRAFFPFRRVNRGSAVDDRSVSRGLQDSAAVRPFGGSAQRSGSGPRSFSAEAPFRQPPSANPAR